MNNELNITGLKHGAILGVIGSILAFLLISVSRDLYMSISGLGIPLLTLILLIVIGIKERKEKFDNSLNYLAAFVYASIALFIMGNISSLTSVTILNYVDPEIQNILLKEGMADAEKTFRMFGLDEGDIDEQMINLEAQLKNSFQYSSILTNSWAQLLSALFFGTIAAFFIRKSQPDFAE